MKLKVTQLRSTIGRKYDQKRTIAALGLGKINRSRIHDDNPVIRGMVNKVCHLVKVEEIEETGDNNATS
jgi:large subunit ribosomal protein L30